MAPSTFRLDSLAATLVARLEAVRRAHMDDADACAAAIRDAAMEAATAVAAECRATLGDEGQARLLFHEVEATFLPRYTRLAQEQNRDEGRLRLGGIFGQVGGRVLAVPVGLVVMTVLTRVAPGPWDVAFLAVPPAMLFWPDLLGRIWRRRFAGQLQELVDDLGKLQDAHDKLAPIESAEPLRPRPPQREVP